MSVTEAQRLHLFKSFEETLPDDDLATLMELLPPSGWGDVATKRDLDLAVAQLRTDFAHETRRFIGWMLTSDTVLIAAFGAITTTAS